MSSSYLVVPSSYNLVLKKWDIIINLFCSLDNLDEKNFLKLYEEGRVQYRSNWQVLEAVLKALTPKLAQTAGIPVSSISVYESSWGMVTGYTTFASYFTPKTKGISLFFW